MESFYKTFEDIKDNYYDGLIVTGAPVEKMDFEEVDYWEELTQVFEWAKRHVFSTLHLCWGAQAGLYHRYGIQKVELCDKLSGIYDQVVVRPESLLMRGFDDRFLAPHSRYTDIPLKEVLEKSNLQVIATLMRMMPIQNLAFVGILLRRPSLVIGSTMRFIKKHLTAWKNWKKIFHFMVTYKGEL